METAAYTARAEAVHSPVWTLAGRQDLWSEWVVMASVVHAGRRIRDGGSPSSTSNGVSFGAKDDAWRSSSDADDGRWEAESVNVEHVAAPISATATVE